jgi:hypothetical protein
LGGGERTGFHARLGLEEAGKGMIVVMPHDSSPCRGIDPGFHKRFDSHAFVFLS